MRSALALGFFTLLCVCDVQAQAQRAPPCRKSAKGTFSREATLLFLDDAKSGDAVCIKSPDGRKTIVAVWGNLSSAYPTGLYVVDRGKRLDFNPMFGFNGEAAWAPDSKAFFVTYSAGGAIGGYLLVVLYLEEGGLRLVQPTEQVQDKYLSHPLHCWSGKTEEPNLAGVAWGSDSSHLLVAAETIPHSNCAEMGTFRLYEMLLPEGTIRREFEQLESKRTFWKRLGPELRSAEDWCVRNRAACVREWDHKD